MFAKGIDGIDEKVDGLIEKFILKKESDYKFSMNLTSILYNGEVLVAKHFADLRVSLQEKNKYCYESAISSKFKVKALILRLVTNRLCKRRDEVIRAIPVANCILDISEKGNEVISPRIKLTQSKLSRNCPERDKLIMDENCEEMKDAKDMP